MRSCRCSPAERERPPATAGGANGLPSSARAKPDARSSFDAYGASGSTPGTDAVAGHPFILAIARDGADTYWISDDLPKPSDGEARVPLWNDCITHANACNLMRSSNLPVG